MTLADPEVPLVYSLDYVQEGCQDCEDELPHEAIGRMKKQEKANSNLHAGEVISDKLESMNLDPHLSKLTEKYHVVFGLLPPPVLQQNGPPGP